MFIFAGKNNWVICVLLVLSISGCKSLSALSKMDQLLTLKDMAGEAQEIDAYVESRNQSFTAMLAQYEIDQLAAYDNKEEIVAAYGEPVFTHVEARGEETVEQWLYRREDVYFNTDKIYLYFDKSGNLVGKELLPKELE